MDRQSAERGADPLLWPLLGDVDDAEWDRLSARLVAEHVHPIVKGVVWRRFGGGAFGSNADADDLCADVVVRLLGRLRGLKDDADPIADLHGYVAVTAFNACDDHLRRKYPERARLKNRLRYTLTHRAEFALWQDASLEWQAGLAAWKDVGAPGDATRLRRLLDRPREAMIGLEGVRSGRPDSVALLNALFGAAGQPIGLEDLVGIAAEVSGIREPALASLADDDQEGAGVERLPDPRPSAAVAIDRRRYLQRLWGEICDLPLRQRTALLLNLRDAQGNGFLDLLPLIGVASMRELAVALEMPAQELARLWAEVPLGDAALAARLGVTRQQVVNLRKSARERLARRMRAHGF